MVVDFGSNSSINLTMGTFVLHFRVVLLYLYVFIDNASLYLVFTSLLLSAVCGGAVLMGSLQSDEEVTASSSLFEELMMVFVVSSCFRGEIYQVKEMLCH